MTDDLDDTTLVLSQWRPRACAGRSTPLVLGVGLTGGIGSGKSTVADLLVARGAVLIDADQVARDVGRRAAPPTSR